ncbi:ATP-binding protein [Kibdelosporangium lantanae]
MRRLTVRARLTLVYGGVFVLGGIALLVITYGLAFTKQVGPVAQQFIGDPPPIPRMLPDLDALARDVQNDTLRSVLTQGGLALALVTAVATALGWVVAGRMLRPLHRVTETARRIASAPAAAPRLHDRIALTGPRDEIRELADTFDVMLEHLDRAFDGQRRFIANASHELRTPLTLNRALLETAVHRGPDVPELRVLGTTLLDINARHERLIDGLLLLARSERDVGERSFVDLADVVDHVASMVPAGDVTVHSDPGEAPTNGNPVLLERLVHNLVENGVRHNIAADGWVRVTSRTQPYGVVEVEVSNTGPVVPPYEVESLFEPFRRLAGRSHEPSQGAGLGLSIVRAVARAHGGTVHAEPRPGGGLVVLVRLPAAPAVTPASAVSGSAVSGSVASDHVPPALAVDQSLVQHGVQPVEGGS